MMIARLVRFMASTMKESMRAHQEMLKQKYQEFKHNQFRIYKPKLSQDHFVKQDQVARMQKEVELEVVEFRKNNAIRFDCSGFIKLLGKVSYIYDNQKIIAKEEFQQLLQQAQDHIYQFKDVREIALLTNFCSLYNINNEEIWFTASRHIQNQLNAIKPDDALLILQSVNEHNIKYFGIFFEHFEVKILEQLPRDHSLGVAALQIFRKHDKGNESFYYSIKEFVINNLSEMRLDCILKYLQYYGLSNEPLQDKSEVLNAIMLHLYKIMTFLNKKQLLTVYYIYVRTQQGSDVLYRLIEERVSLMIEEFQLGEIEKLLVIAANQGNKIIFKHAEKLLQRRLIDTRPQDLVQVAVLFIENKVGSEEFIKSLEQHLIPGIHTTDLEELPELIWALVQNESNLRWMEKIAEACLERVPKMSVKVLTSLVWMTSDYFKRLPNKEKQKSKLIDLYEQIEKRIIEEFENYCAGLRDTALVLNAYARNLPISIHLVKLMEIYVLNSTQDELIELDGWAISQILWGFNQIDGFKQMGALLSHLTPVFMEVLAEMNMTELLTSMQVFTVNRAETREMTLAAIQKTSFWVERMELSEVYLGLHVFSNSSFGQSDYYFTIRSQEVEDILRKLIARLEYLKSVKPVEPDQVDEQLREYQLQAEVEEFK